jgi:hypothetical protein
MKTVIPYDRTKDSIKFAKLLSQLLNKKGSIDERAEVFREVIKLRNKNSIKRGFLNQLDLTLKLISPVPSKIYDAYLYGSKDFFEKYSTNKKIEDVDMCGLTFLGLSSTVDKNTTIHRGDYDHASYKYDDQKKTIDIFIPKDVHENQAITMLVHELGHANAIIESKIAPTQFEAEKLAYQYEFDFLKSKSKELFLADLDQYKSCFWRTDFETEAYTNPDQDLFVLSGNNDKYLNDEKLIMKPFTDLPPALAIFDIL